MKNKRLAVLMAGLFLLAGCWDKVELENRGLVVSVGLDKYQGEGDSENRYAVALALPDAAAMADNKGSGEDSPRQVMKADSRTVSGAVRDMDNSSNYKIYLGQAKIAVFGKELLENPTLFKETVDYLERNREINRKISVLATKERAAEILEAKPKGSPMVGMYVASYYQNNSDAVVLRENLEKLIGELRASGNAVIPEIKREEKGIELSGAAVIKDFKLTGFLDEQETRGFQWVNGGCQNAVVTVEDGGVLLPMVVDRHHGGVGFYEDGNGLGCYMDIDIEGHVEEYKFLDESLSKDGKLPELARLYEEVVRKEVEKTSEKFQRGISTDGYQLKEKLRRKNYTLYRKYAEDWERVFQSMTIKPRVRVRLTGAGSIK